MAPKNHADSVLALLNYYFMPARLLHDLMWQAKDDYNAASTEEERDSIEQTVLQIFMNRFVASLFPLCDGFRKLGLKDPTVDPLIAELMSTVRGAAKIASTYVSGTEYVHQATLLINVSARAPDMNTVERLYSAIEAYFATFLNAKGVFDD